MSDIKKALEITPATSEEIKKWTNDIVAAYLAGSRSPFNVGHFKALTNLELNLESIEFLKNAAELSEATEQQVSSAFKREMNISKQETLAPNPEEMITDDGVSIKALQTEFANDQSQEKVKAWLKVLDKDELQMVVLPAIDKIKGKSEFDNACNHIDELMGKGVYWKDIVGKDSRFISELSKAISKFLIENKAEKFSSSYVLALILKDGELQAVAINPKAKNITDSFFNNLNALQDDQQPIALSETVWSPTENQQNLPNFDYKLTLLADIFTDKGVKIDKLLIFVTKDLANWEQGQEEAILKSLSNNNPETLKALQKMTWQEIKAEINKAIGLDMALNSYGTNNYVLFSTFGNDTTAICV